MKPTLFIPEIKFVFDGDWTKARQAFNQVPPIWLDQPWRSQRETNFAPGCVHLAVNGSDLLLYSLLQDDTPRNTAAKWNEPTWKTGDVLELFIGLHGRPDYYEFHVTPENQRLQLHFDGPETIIALRAGGDLKDICISESKFESATQVAELGKEWQVFLRVNLRALFGAWEGNQIRFMVGRYDYQPDGGIVCSCTGSLKAPDFHRTEEWTLASVESSAKAMERVAHQDDVPTV